MKIYDVCHVSSAHVGLELRIYLKQCISLANAGKRVALIITATSDEVERAKIENIDLYTLRSNSSCGRYKRIIVKSFSAFLRTFNVKAKFYHFHDPELLPYALLMAFFGKKVIFDSHENVSEDILTKDWIPFGLRKIISCLYISFEYMCSLFLVGRVAATPSIFQSFVGVSRNDIVINNYPFLNEFIPLDCQIEENRMVLVYVGLISRARGIFQLIESLPYTNATLILAGRYESDALKNELMSMQGWNQVVDHGVVSRETVRELFTTATVGIVTYLPGPNHDDSQPNKLFEYMSAGLPVICSDFPIWKTIVEDGFCGITVNPSDPVAISRCINSLENKTDLLQRMGSCGRSLAINKYNWRSEELKLIDFYNKLELKYY